MKMDDRFDQALAGLPPHLRLFYRGLRVFFAWLYHGLAWTYDGVAAIVSLGMWQDWVFSVIPFLEGPRVLELGHGPGHLQAALLSRGLRVYGLDESRQMGRQAYQRARWKGLSPALSRGLAQQMPFAAGAFQQVTATFPSEYILDERTFREIWRVLAPGGQVVILPLAWITGKGLLERAAAWLFRATGQAPAWNERALDPVRRAGFEPRVERINLKSSQVLIIIACKSRDHPV
jgi:ubiquinone/menaquinone biosynthesis C-methylase UbiE